MTDADDLHDLAAAYALDALDPDDQHAFERHLDECSSCQAEVATHWDTIARLELADPVAPPTSLRDGVLATIASTPQEAALEDERSGSAADGEGVTWTEPTTGGPLPDGAEVIDLDSRRRRRLVAIGLAAAAVVVIAGAIGVGLGAGQFGSDGDTDVAASPLDEVIAAPDAVTVDLAPTPEAGTGAGTVEVVYSAEQGRVAIVGDEVAGVAADRAYALWFVLDDAVAPAGLFTPDDDGTVRAVIDVDDLAPAGWGITVEPDTGSPQPTSDILYLGEI